jgi:hypothetical protein
LGYLDVVVNAEVWYGIVDWVIIFPLWVEVLAALGTVADWITLDEILLVNFNIGFPEWGKVFWSTGGGILASWMSV